MRIAAWFCLSFLMAIPAFSPAMAAVDAVGPSGFTVSQKTHITAAPDAVWAALIQIGKWWSPEHSYSLVAANMTLDAKAGGCFCEALPGGGSVQHMVVVFAKPAAMLRLRGALGPMQQMGVDGALTWTLTAKDGGTDLTMRYAVGGYVPGGFDGLSKGVDAVLSQQVTRLQRFVETGAPVAKTP